MSGARNFRIGEVATATGVTVEALRFYERKGLLSAPLRSSAGARRYGADVLDRVRFIKQAQAAGLTLRDIAVLVKSRRDPSGAGCRRIRAVLATRIAEIEQRVQEMQTFRDVLREHLARCDRALADQRGDCPTVDAMERAMTDTPEGPAHENR